MNINDCLKLAKDLTIDSRMVKPGDLFFAYPGEHVDGRDYIQSAIENGASVIVAEGDEGFSSEPVPTLYVKNLSQKIGDFAAQFFGFPSSELHIIGVTGTNGKTSVTQFIAHALKAVDVKCGVMGTIGYGFPGHMKTATHTTFDPVLLQRTLSEFKDAGASVVAMEVSSHGLDQGRVSSVEFDTAVFTNLSHDHLDYHGTMEAYWAAKQKLFEFDTLKNAIINTDDPRGLELYERLSSRDLNCVAYGLQESKQNNYFTANQISCDQQGFSADVLYSSASAHLNSSLLGRFNVSNVLAAVGALLCYGISFDAAVQAVGKLKTVNGRLQAFGGGPKPLVVVDYAHTPDALEKALLALREHCDGKLWCVFGCGGDRDREKRPVMGKIAERLSDQIVITDDNPRHEDGDEIVNHIKSGLVCAWAAEIERDRSSAIAHAIDCADVGDIVLVAGKGHETYQQVGDEKIEFSDVDEVTRLLG